MKTFCASFLVALAVICITVHPLAADVIPMKTPTPVQDDCVAKAPSQFIEGNFDKASLDSSLAQLTQEDLAFFSAHPDAIQLSAGLTWDEFLYGSLLLLAIVAGLLVGRALVTRHRS